MEEMIYPWCWRIKNQGVELSLDGIFDIVAEYYGKEPYYDEVVERDFVKPAPNDDALIEEMMTSLRVRE